MRAETMDRFVAALLAMTAGSLVQGDQIRAIRPRGSFRIVERRQISPRSNLRNAHEERMIGLYHDEGTEPVAREASPLARRAILTRALSLAAGLPLLAGLMPVAARAAGKEAGPAIVNVVTFTVPFAGVDKFLAICKDNSRASLKEPGCTGFEVLIPEGDLNNKVMLIETYRDEAAYQAHRVTPHFLAFVEGAQEVGAQRSAVVSRRVFPV